MNLTEFQTQLTYFSFQTAKYMYNRCVNNEMA